MHKIIQKNNFKRSAIKNQVHEKVTTVKNFYKLKVLKKIQLRDIKKPVDFRDINVFINKVP